MAGAIVLFVCSRLFLLYGFTPLYSDVSLYADYAWQHTLARDQGKTLYQYRADEFARATIAARQGLGPPPVRGSDTVEYPPLALAIVLLPNVFIGPPEPATFLERYTAAFRHLMALADAIGFGVVLLLARRLFPSEGPWQQAARLTTYTLAGFLLGHLLYDRFDVVLAMALIGSLALLLTRKSLTPFLALLALAIHIKLVPILLVPALLVAALDLKKLARRHGRDRALAVIRDAGRNGAVLVLMGAGALVPFYAAWGGRCLDFLRFHGQRGVQVESTYAAALLVARACGFPVKLVLEYGGADVLSPVSRFLGRLSPVLIVVATGGLVASLWTRVAGRLDAPSAAPDKKKGVTSGLFAHAEPLTVVSFVLATVLAALVTSKVLSAQYMIWLVPLFALVPATGMRRHLLLIGFLVVCTLTSALFPYLYVEHLVGALRDPVTGEFTHRYAGPTSLGTIVLVARNLGLIALAGFLAPRWRRIGAYQE